jgi:hypothetical protein
LFNLLLYECQWGKVFLFFIFILFSTAWFFLGVGCIEVS